MAARLFLFIDETGDPGHIAKEGSSPYYQVNIVSCTEVGLEEITKQISRFRFFRKSGKELKRYKREADLLIDICMVLYFFGVVFQAFIIQKEAFFRDHITKKRCRKTFQPNAIS